MCHDIFISYSSENESLTCELCDILETRSWKCWFARRDIIPGKNWGESIIEAINQSRAMILILTAQSNGSEQVTREVERAIHKRIPILALRLEDIPLSKAMEFYLSSVHWMNLLTPPPAAHWEEVAQQIERLLQGARAGRQEGGHTSPPLIPALPISAGIERPPPEGGLAPDDPSYIRRPPDDALHLAVKRGDSVILIRGARQVGKTSAMARAVFQARQAGMRVVITDLQQFNNVELESTDRFLLALGERIANKLNLGVRPRDHWDDCNAPNCNFNDYLHDEVLSPSSDRLVLVFDEVDRLFSCDFGSEIFALFRSWHNARVFEPEETWNRLTVVFAYATEAQLFIKDLNQSPFNVRTMLSLGDFTTEQRGELNRRRGSPLHDSRDEEHFFNLLGGHPYLTNRGSTRCKPKRCPPVSSSV